MDLRFLFLNCCIGIGAAFFTSRPVSQNVYLGQRVEFECSTSFSGYSLIVLLSKTGINDVFGQISLPGGGLRVTSSFIVTEWANATTAICIGHSPNNGSSFSTPPAAVYAQGAPEKVRNVGVMALCQGSVFIFWDPVFTLKNLSVQYLITVNDHLLDPISTFYAYHELTDAKDGETALKITVMASNAVGNGTITTLPNTVYNVTNLQLSYDQSATIRGITHWTARFNSEVSTIKNTMKDAIVENYTKVHSCSNTTNACLNSTNVTISNDQVTWINNLWLREKYSNYLVVQCSNSLKAKSNQVEISTHDVQSINDFTFQNGIVCLNFSLINGWKLNAIHLHFEGLKKMISVNVSVTIPSKETILYSCSNDTENWNFMTENSESLTPGNWILYACDEPGPDDRCTNPADAWSIKIDATQTAASVAHAIPTQLHLILSGLLIMFVVLL